MKLSVALATLAVASASADQMTLLQRIKAQLASGGATNCQYKCANLFNINNIWDENGQSGGLNGLAPGSPSSVLNEFLGCFSGCDICNGGETKTCMKQCKNTMWFVKNWFYNPYSGGVGFMQCDDELVQKQDACVAACGPVPTGGRANLPKSYTQCTQKCYDNKNYGIVAINSACNANCRAKATCTAYDYTTQECSTDDVTMQYTAEMCGSGVLKNIIEPDKACIFGCVQNLCQDGAGCTGTGLWSTDTNNQDCQLITPQSNGEVYTIVPDIFNAPQSDLTGCCAQSQVCCSYLPAWAANNAGTSGGSSAQRQSVCDVANKKTNCGADVPGFNIKDYGNDISSGDYPGDGCNELWKTGGICESAGFPSCPSCQQHN